MAIPLIQSLEGFPVEIFPAGLFLAVFFSVEFFPAGFFPVGVVFLAVFFSVEVFPVGFYSVVVVFLALFFSVGFFPVVVVLLVVFYGGFSGRFSVGSLAAILLIDCMVRISSYYFLYCNLVLFFSGKQLLQKSSKYQVEKFFFICISANLGTKSLFSKS